MGMNGSEEGGGWSGAGKIRNSEVVATSMRVVGEGSKQIFT